MCIRDRGDGVGVQQVRLPHPLPLRLASARGGPPVIHLRAHLEQVRFLSYFTMLYLPELVCLQSEESIKKRRLIASCLFMLSVQLFARFWVALNLA